MEIVLWILGVLLLGAFIEALIKNTIFAIRWYVFGWRPKIFDQETVDSTATEFANEVLANDLKECDENGHPLTEEQKTAHVERIRLAFKEVIARYCMKFSLK